MVEVYLRKINENLISAELRQDGMVLDVGILDRMELAELYINLLDAAEDCNDMLRKLRNDPCL